LPDGRFDFFVRARLGCLVKLGETGFDRLKKSQIIADFERLGCGTANPKAFCNLMTFSLNLSFHCDGCTLFYFRRSAM
jgi:hypothetical protein